MSSPGSTRRKLLSISSSPKREKRYIQSFRIGVESLISKRYQGNYFSIKRYVVNLTSTKNRNARAVKIIFEYRSHKCILRVHFLRECIFETNISECIFYRKCTYFYKMHFIMHYRKSFIFKGFQVLKCISAFTFLIYKDIHNNTIKM